MGRVFYYSGKEQFLKDNADIIQTPSTIYGWWTW